MFTQSQLGIEHLKIFLKYVAFEFVFFLYFCNDKNIGKDVCAILCKNNTIEKYFFFVFFFLRYDI